MKIKLKDPRRNHLTMTERKAIISLLFEEGIINQKTQLQYSLIRSFLFERSVGRKIYRVSNKGRYYYQVIIWNTTSPNGFIPAKTVVFKVEASEGL